jgi:hypothetical protein
MHGSPPPSWRARVVFGAARSLGLVALALGSLGATCGQSGLALMPGVVNDPANYSLRQSIIAFATQKACDELRGASVPLRLRTEDPSLGRFFPTGCVSETLPNQHLVVRFSGYGYAWTNLTGRMSFDASAAAEYELDFQMDGSTMYVYLRGVSVTQPSFKARLVERPAPLGALGLGGASLDAIGLSLMKTELLRGFTVVRDGDSNTVFASGLVAKGQLPPRAFASRDGSARRFVINDRIEVHENQRDYVGPFTAQSSITMTISVDGAPGIDALLVQKGTGDNWLNSYTRELALGPPPGQVGVDEPIIQGMTFRRSVKVPPGSYYLVLDHTAVAGRTRPPGFPGDDRAALVSLAIE